MPVEAAGIHQTPPLSLHVIDQVLVGDVDDPPRRDLSPMGHETIMGRDVATDIRQVIGIGAARLEQGLVQGIADVHRCPADMDDPRVRQGPGDQADIEEIHRGLVDQMGRVDFISGKALAKTVAERGHVTGHRRPDEGPPIGRTRRRLHQRHGEVRNFAEARDL